MKNTSSLLPSTSAAGALAPTPAAPADQPGRGRPSFLNEHMIEALCSIIRETGASDSGAAARMSLHPSTLSRWKKESPSLAILLRTAREDFRSAQLEVILATARAGASTSWRASAWLLERVFPEDYAPRAAERARFQELFEARCAGEVEGGESALPAEGEPLQNVKNAGRLSAPAPPSAPAAPAAPAVELVLPPAQTAVPREFRLSEAPLQNVKYSPLSGPLCPPVLHPHSAQG